MDLIDEIERVCFDIEMENPTGWTRELLRLNSKLREYLTECQADLNEEEVDKISNELEEVRDDLSKAEDRIDELETKIDELQQELDSKNV